MLLVLLLVLVVLLLLLLQLQVLLPLAIVIIVMISIQRRVILGPAVASTHRYGLAPLYLIILFYLRMWINTCCPPTPAINRTGERINPKGLIRTPGLSIFWGLAFLRFWKEKKYPGYDTGWVMVYGRDFN